MRSHEPKAFVEAVSVGSPLVRRQLHQGAVSALRLLDRPLEQRSPQSVTAVILPDPHRLNLGSQSPTPGEPGKKTQLHGGQDLRAIDGDQQKVRRIGVDGSEGAQVQIEVRSGADAVTSAAQLIIGQQLNKRGDILYDGFTQDDRRAQQGQLLQHAHPVRMPCLAQVDELTAATFRFRGRPVDPAGDP